MNIDSARKKLLKTFFTISELGLPYTVPPWDQTFPQNTFKKYTWQQICQMSGLELLQHFTVRFSPVIWRSRSSLRQVTYRCNLVSACRREFSGVVGVQKMIRHIKRHLAKLEEHRILSKSSTFEWKKIGMWVDLISLVTVGADLARGVVS